MNEVSQKKKEVVNNVKSMIMDGSVPPVSTQSVQMQSDSLEDLSKRDLARTATMCSMHNQDNSSCENTSTPGIKNVQ